MAAMLKLFTFLSISIFYAAITTASDELSFSASFPSAAMAKEFVRLSDAVYYLRSCKNKHLPSSVTCHTYNHTKGGTQVMIVSSDEKKYVAIVYAGSDNVKNWISDFDVSMSDFGPADNPIVNAKVHDGFNHGVFDEGLFDDIQSTAKELLEQYPGYRIFISGHSLGAAESILTGAAMAHFDPTLNITVINFGCPKVGSREWKDWANSLPNLGVWRLVHREDIVPRMPSTWRFSHVGHTVQLNKRNAKAYYLHYGDKDLGYKSVPWNWESGALATPTASAQHFIRIYVKYVTKKSAKNPDKYFVNDFVKKKAENDVEFATIVY